MFANLIDQLDLAPNADKYYMRKWNRRVDGNPVLIRDWNYVDIADPEGVKVQSLADVGLGDPAAQAKAQEQNPPTKPKHNAGETFTPYGQSSNTLNAAQRLQQQLGLKR